MTRKRYHAAKLLRKHTTTKNAQLSTTMSAKKPPNNSRARQFATTLVSFTAIKYRRCSDGPWKPLTVMACAMFSLLQREIARGQTDRVD